MKTRRRRRRRKAAPRYSFRDLISVNSVAAMKDESYTMVQRCVEELMRDPELREKIEYHARQIMKAIAAKL